MMVIVTVVMLTRLLSPKTKTREEKRQISHTEEPPIIYVTPLPSRRGSVIPDPLNVHCAMWLPQEAWL